MNEWRRFEGEMIYSQVHKEWIKILIVNDQFEWWFVRAGKTYKSTTPLDYYLAQLTRGNDRRTESQINITDSKA